MQVDEADDAGRPRDTEVDIVEFDWVEPGGVSAGWLRVDLRRRAGATRFLAAVLRPGRDPVVVIDHDLPLATRAFEFRAPAVWAELICEQPLVHWSVGLEAFGLELDPHETATPASFGGRVPVGFELDVETAGPVSHGTFGFEVAVAVSGEVLLADDALEVDAVGVRRRRWDGERPTAPPAAPGAPVGGALAVGWPPADGRPSVEERAWHASPTPEWVAPARQV